MAEYVKQHFIPECYLKNFTLDGKGILVYGKQNPNKIFRQSISNIAYADNFYDIVDPTFKIETGLDLNTLEREFFSDTFEKHFSELLKKIISLCNEESVRENDEIFNQYEIDIFSELIAVQYIRLPQFRRKFWNLFKDSTQKTNEILVSYLQYLSGNTTVNIRPVFDEKKAADYHAGFLFDENFRYDIQEALRDKIWVFYFTEENLFTSDNPILCKPHIVGSPSMLQGFGMKGVEVIFPISKNIILTMWDEKVFEKKKPMHNKVFRLEGKNLREYNLYQYCFAESQIYSSINDFDIIFKFKNLNNDNEFLPKPASIKVY